MDPIQYNGIMESLVCCVHEWMDVEWMNERWYDSIGAWMNEWTNDLMDDWVNEWLDAWTVEWKHGWMSGRMTDLLQVMELLLCDSQGGGRLRQLFLEPNEVHVVPDGRPDDQTHHTT